MNDTDGAIEEALRELPVREPRPDAWRRLRARAEREGLLAARRRVPTALRVLGGGAVAAAVALVAIGIAGRGPAPVTDQGAPAAFPATPAAGTGALGELMSQSRRLERRLRALPAAPSVRRVSTASAVTALEDRIRSVDHAIAYAEPDAAERLWRARVELMRSLVQLRRADTWANAAADSRAMDWTDTRINTL